MNNTFNSWYWEYAIEIWDCIDSKKDVRSGIVFAETMNEALQNIIEYYGEDDILNIMTFKPIIDGAVFDFNYVTKDEYTDFDFAIEKKE